MNGWNNYETWAVNLWATNDQESHQWTLDVAREAWNDAPSGDGVLTRSERARYNLADYLKDHYEESAPELSGVYVDLLNAALSEVDWSELADAWLRNAEIADYESTEAR